jgi:hypothetical protein
MALTYARTTSNTYTRLDLITMQVRVVLRKAGIEEVVVNRVSKGLGLKWIERVAICGQNARGLTSCQLGLKIDWSRHELHMAAGRSTVPVGGEWKDGLAIEVQEPLSLYLDCVRARGLHTRLYLWYPPTVPRETANRELGFVTASPPRWAGNPEAAADFRIHELDEVTAEYSMVLG